jgi:hypothetical protein
MIFPIPLPTEIERIILIMKFEMELAEFRKRHKERSTSLFVQLTMLQRYARFHEDEDQHMHLMVNGAPFMGPGCTGSRPIHN